MTTKAVTFTSVYDGARLVLRFEDIDRVHQRSGIAAAFHVRGLDSPDRTVSVRFFVPRRQRRGPQLLDLRPAARHCARVMDGLREAGVTVRGPGRRDRATTPTPER